MARYYALLLSRQDRTITLPIKALFNRYTGGMQAQYTGGFPNFFGGDAAAGETPEQTLSREVQEESRGTLQLNGGLTEIYRSRCQGQPCIFYLAADWDRLHDDWPAPQTREQGEMDRIVTLSLDEFADAGDPEEIITRLLELCGIDIPQGAQRREFDNSQTRCGFIEAVQWLTG